MWPNRVASWTARQDHAQNVGKMRRCLSSRSLASSSDFLVRKARALAPMPYRTPRQHRLQTSRTWGCVSAVAHSGASLAILANHMYGSPLAMASSMCWSPLRAAAITNSWDFQSRYARTRPRGGLIRPRNQRLGPKMDLPAWCALRPVLHTNWPSRQRLRPSAPRVIEFSRSLAMVCRSWCRCASCGYSSAIALKVSSRRSGTPDSCAGQGMSSRTR